MTSPNTRQPARLEDLLDCLAWPILLRLPRLSLGASRLILAYLVAALILIVVGADGSRLAIACPVPGLTTGAPSIGGTAELTLGEQMFMNMLGSGDNPFEGLAIEVQATKAPPSGPSLADWLCTLIALVLAGGLFTMLARSTALEVSRDVIASPRASINWLSRRWPSVLGVLWPLPLIAVGWLIARLLVWVAGGLSALPLIATLLPLIAAAVLLAVLVGGAIAMAAALLIPSARACDDGDNIDAVQRSIALVLASPFRAALCGGWIALVAGFFAWIAGTANGAVRARLIQMNPELADRIDSAMWPLDVIPLALALSVLGSGLTLAYLYLRRAADQQDITEVPISG